LGQLTGSEITEERLNACYVSSNYTPRTYYGEVLTDGDFRKNAVQELFKTPAAFAKARDKDYDCIIVDEAHRMYTWKFGLGLKKSVDVIDTLFKASLVNVFFLDENQEVTTSDYLTEDKIRMYASRYGSEVIAGDKLTLTSQFRCAGGQQYIDYVEHFLGYNHNPVNLRGMRYEFRIFDSIKDMVEAIHKKQERPETEKSRILSGYTKAHNWVSKDDSNAFDFDYPEEGVKLQWNKTVSGRAAVMEESQKDRVFYVNMVQGVDLDYAGVILCRDVRYENGEVTFHQEEDADTDGFSGIRACKDKEKAIQLIRNSYRVLLTRGTRGTYLYVEDPALREHLKNLAKN
ncbi:MAG: DNA/RNA helicase domain-containing protein, partial [Bacilli bacterium]